MKIIKYIILILAVVQLGSLSALALYQGHTGPYPNVNLATKSYTVNNFGGQYTFGHDPDSSYMDTPIGTVIKVRIKTTTTWPMPAAVRLYSNNNGNTIVSSSTTGDAVSLGSEVWEYTLDTPLDVTAWTQMLAYVSGTSLYADVDPEGVYPGYELKYCEHAASTCNPTNSVDNVFIAIQYVYGASPADLVVIDPSVSEAALTLGQSFTISATVKNLGSASSNNTNSSDSTTLRYYSSTDSTISTEDTQLGTVPVDPLSPNGESLEDITVSAPVVEGTYWVGACVDPSESGESPDNNQCSAGVQIEVGLPPSAQKFYPDVDLATESFIGTKYFNNHTLGHDPTSLFEPTAIGTVIKVRVRTSTQFMTYYTTTVSLYSDETATTLLSSSETDKAVDLGNDLYEFTLISPIGVSSGEQMLAYFSRGSYYDNTRTGFTTKYYESTGDPTKSMDNMFMFVQFVYDVPTYPDLVVINPSVSETALTSGQSFTISATVMNQGSDSSGSTTLRYYSSTDSTISTEDTQLGTGPV